MTANKRRTLGAALDVSPDKLAFIKGGMPTQTTPSHQSLSEQDDTSEQTQTPRLTVKAMGPSETRMINTKNIELENEATDQRSDRQESVEQRAIEQEAIDREPTDTNTRRHRPRSRREPTPREETYAGLTNMLVPLTTRLSPPTAAALKRAGLEQKLYGRQPGTVQEIAEEAIKDWLNGQGYL